MPTIPQTRYHYGQDDPQTAFEDYAYTEVYEQESYDSPTRPRASGIHPPLNSATRYPMQQRRIQPPAPQDAHPLPPRAAYPSYRPDDYGYTLPSDVIEEDASDDYEDGPGLVYGDYLGEGEEEDYGYSPHDVEALPPAYPTRQQPGPMYSNPGISRQDTLPPTNARPMRVTRDLRMPMPAQPPQLPPARNQHPAQLPPARGQHSQFPTSAPAAAAPSGYSSRTTQPLDPRNIQDLRRKRLEAEAYQASISRDIALRPRLPEPLEIHEQRPARATCPKCKGAGYLRANVNFGHPNFGKPIPCSCKMAEIKEKRRVQLRELSNLDAYQDRNFQTFKPNVYGVGEAYHAATDYAEDPRGWLLLVGPNGCGKTHLALAIAHQRLEAGDVVLFSVVIDLLRHLRATFAPNATEVYDQLFSKMCEAGVLILDDLGAEQSSPWAKEKLFELLNYRYNMSMPTVITANPRGIQELDERIRSRLSDISLVRRVDIRAGDYRPKHPGYNN